MRTIDLYNAFRAVDDDILERSETNAYNHKKHEATIFRVSKRRLPAALIAAILAMLLMGAGVVAIIYGDSIQNWFSHYWERITGQQMSGEQATTIDHLSQEIGLSQTIGDVTVTIDSATVGYDNFFLLFRVNGIEFSNKHGYGFEQVIMDVTPDPVSESNGIGGYGFQYYGADGDGSLLLLLEYSYTSGMGSVRDTRPINIALTLENFLQNPHVDTEKLIVTGKWSFDFSLDRSMAIEVLQLPDTEIMLMDSEQQEVVPVTITNIELTNTGLIFRYDYADGALTIDFHINVVLDTGESIADGGSSGTLLEDGKTLNCSYQWLVPVDLDAVASIQIGDTTLIVP